MCVDICDVHIIAAKLLLNAKLHQFFRICLKEHLPCTQRAMQNSTLDKVNFMDLSEQARLHTASVYV